MMKNANEMVKEFVRKSRCSVSDTFLEPEQTRLKILFDECISQFINKDTVDLLPSFIICETYNKYSKLLPVRIGKKQYKYYLVYDCHLNKINRLLDIFYLDDSDPAHDIWKLSYELFAEDALVESDEVLTTYYGLNKTALGPFEASDNEMVDLDFIVDVQERYIIGHELGHWIFHILNNQNAEKTLNVNFDGDWHKFVNDIRLLLCELYTEYENLFNAKEYIEIIREQNSIVNEKCGICEECFCDAVAYAMIFSYVQNRYSDDLKYKLLAGKALFLEMMNLQLLAMQHMAMSEESFESATSIRLAFLRNYLGLYFSHEEKAFNKMLECTVIRYEERITNLILECFSELEKRADNIYNALIDDDGLLDMSKVVGLDIL